MDEMYRMLGREHEADLEREAMKWQRAAEVCPLDNRAAHEDPVVSAMSDSSIRSYPGLASPRPRPRQ